MTLERIDAADLQTGDVFALPDKPLYGKDANYYEVHEREMETDGGRKVIYQLRTVGVGTPRALTMYVRVNFKDPEGSVISSKFMGQEFDDEKFGTEVIPAND